MAITVELRVLNLLCARLCHDLAGPVGAIRNGLELIRDFDEAEGEAFDLVDETARRVAERLQLFRVAYGLGTGVVETFADVGRLVAPVVEAQKIALEWPDAAQKLTDGGVKLLLNMAILAVETLPRGGILDASLGANEGDQVAAEIVAKGDGAALADDLAAAMNATVPIEALTPRTVQGYFTARLADSVGSELRAAASPGRIIISATLPVAA